MGLLVAVELERQRRCCCQAEPELEVLPELLQAVTVIAAATIAARDAALTRLTGQPASSRLHAFPSH